MARIAPLDPAEADGRAKQLLDGVQASLGVTPTMTRVMARSAVLEGYLALGAALHRGTVRVPVAERIALAVAEANGCGYCLAAHGYLAAHVARLDGAEVDRARRFDSADPKAAAMLAFARAVLEGQGAVSDEAFATARAAGLTDAELGDVVGHVAINVLTNYFNKAFETPIDFPVVVPLAAAA